MTLKKRNTIFTFCADADEFESLRLAVVDGDKNVVDLVDALCGAQLNAKRENE
jgi:hypothetical protein